MPETTWYPGQSAVRRDDPKGPVFTILSVRFEGSVRICAVAWLDITQRRCQQEIPAADLIAP